MNTMRIDEEDQNNEDERTFGVVTPSGYVVVTLGHDGLLRCVELLGKVTEGEGGGQGARPAQAGDGGEKWQQETGQWHTLERRPPDDNESWQDLVKSLHEEEEDAAN